MLCPTCQNMISWASLAVAAGCALECPQISGMGDGVDELIA